MTFIEKIRGEDFFRRQLGGVDFSREIFPKPAYEAGKFWPLPNHMERPKFTEYADLRSLIVIE